MKEVFNSIVTSLKEGNAALTAIQRLLINSIGETRAVEQTAEESERATVLSILDHCIAHPSGGFFDSMTLLQFVRSYSMPKEFQTIEERIV